MNPNPRPVTRRTAMCAVLVGLVAPGALVACTTSVNQPKTSTAPGTAVAKLADVPLGSGVVVDGPTGPLLLVQEEQGKVSGYDARCPHAGTTVNPPSNGVIICPAHGSEFNPANGDLERGPAPKGLTPIPVKVAGTQVVLA